MGIDVKDLPAAYQAQALRKWAEQERRRKRRPLPCPAVDGLGKSTKYNNKPTERLTAGGNVICFQSQKEARRYDELMLMLNVGQIRDLRLQVDFTLQEAYTDAEGRRVRTIRYRADVTYLEKRFVDKDGFYEEKLHWYPVVEDVKSRATKTKTYAMKRKLMKERFNIDIQEV